ncbi:TIGR04255 family protein [Streptomyces xanthophaeus]
MYENREIYPDSPLALVAAEIKYPYAPRLRQPDALDRIQLALEEEFPIRQREQRLTLQFASAPSVSPPQMVEVFRFLDRARRRSVVISPEAFSVEVTDYTEFPHFRDLVTLTCEAIQAERAVPAVDRIGLRYIDEIRVPEPIKEASQWRNWVSGNLIPKLDTGLNSPKSVQGVALYDIGESSRLRLSYASLEGPGVVSNEPLRRKFEPDVGPFFVVDIDSYWEAASPEESREFSAAGISDLLGSLHNPMGRVFQSVLTDRLRQVFRGE